MKEKENKDYLYSDEDMANLKENVLKIIENNLNETEKKDFIKKYKTQDK